MIRSGDNRKTQLLSQLDQKFFFSVSTENEGHEQGVSGVRDAENISEVGDEELLEIVDDELVDQDEDSEVDETEHSDVSFDSGQSRSYE